MMGVIMADALHIRIASRATVCRANACGMAPSAGSAIGRRLPSPEFHPKSDDRRCRPFRPYRENSEESDNRQLEQGSGPVRSSKGFKEP
jgi:hypothetical protein